MLLIADISISVEYSRSMEVEINKHFNVQLCTTKYVSPAI